MIEVNRHRDMAEPSGKPGGVVVGEARQGLKSFRWYVAVAAILLVASSLRFPDLQKVPLPLADEIVAAVDFHYLMTTGHHFDGAHAGVLAYLTPALDGRFVVWFFGGSTVPDLRLIAALFGVLTVGLMVWLGRELGDVRIGVVSAAALAVMPWHIYYSRIFFPGSEYLFLTILALCSELAALRRRSVVVGMVAALAAAGSIYLYPVALVSTPLLTGAVLAYRWRELRTFGGLRSAAVAAFCGVVLVLPYAIEHLVVTDPVVGNTNAVIGTKLIWNHGLDIPVAAGRFLSSWSGYLTPNFLLFHGDPNVAQSTQQMGEVGWALGIVGWIGIVVGILRRNSTDLLLIALTATYPIADALTYFDSLGNSLRGLVGSVLWAVWIAIGILEILEICRKSYRPAVIVAASVLVALQSLLFIGYYFGPYTVQYAYAFETGYTGIYGSLSMRGLQTVPITMHAGYERNVMLEYFSQYRLRALDAPLACNDLPYNVLHYTVLPRLFIVREDRGFAAYPDCVNQTDLIARDQAALLGVVPHSGEPGPRKLDVIIVFPNDPQGDYYTAIWYLHY